MSSSLSEIKARLGQSWTDFQALFRESLKAEYALLNIINEYVCQRTGKQLRPVLALLVGQMLGNCNEQVLQCAVASEMAHTATLLHDDVADEADLRRGDRTVRSYYSPAASVLTGDFWLSRASAMVLKTGDSRIFGLYVETLSDLAEGEMLQMQKAESLDTTYEDYLEIIRRKTASLFSSTAESAAIAAGANHEQILAVRNYACHLGLAFQMRDDIFDYCPEMRTGKKPGVDIVEHKITIPLLCAFENSTPQEVENIKELIRQTGSDETVNARIVSKVIDFVNSKGGMESAQHVLTADGLAAVNALSIFKDNWAKEALTGLARYVCNRDK